MKQKKYLVVKRKPYTRKGGVKVHSATFRIKDLGKPGRGKYKIPVGPHTGWHHTQSAAVRRRHIMSKVPKSLSQHKRYLRAARWAMALHNKSLDKKTKIKSLSDAHYFYGKLEVK